MSIEDARSELYKMSSIVNEKLRERHTGVQHVDLCKKLARATILEEFLIANDPSFNVVDDAMLQTRSVTRSEKDRRQKVYMRLYAKLEARKLKNIQ